MTTGVPLAEEPKFDLKSYLQEYNEDQMRIAVHLILKLTLVPQLQEKSL